MCSPKIGSARAIQGSAVSCASIPLVDTCARNGAARAGLMTHPAVRFFFDRNPGFEAGDELVCLTEITEDNLKSLARREFAKGARETTTDIEFA